MTSEVVKRDELDIGIDMSDMMMMIMMIIMVSLVSSVSGLAAQVSNNG